MGILNTIKNMLGVKQPEAKIEEPVKTTELPAAEKVKKAKSKTKPVTVKPKAEKPKAEKQTKGTLTKMTKVQIDELAKEKFGIELDRRSTKDAMIKEFLSQQKKG